MYKEFDLAALPQSEFLLNTKAIKTIEAYWPTRDIVTDADGSITTVFDKLIVATDEGNVKSDKGHKELYKILGTSYERLVQEEWKGVEKAWFYFSHVDFDKTTVTGPEIFQRLGSVETDKQYAQQKVTFTLTTSSQIDAVTLATMTDGLLAGDPTELSKFRVERGEYVDPRWHVAFADTGQEIFHRSAMVPTPVYKASTTQKGGGYKADRIKRFEEASGIGGWTYAFVLTYTMKDGTLDKYPAEFSSVFDKVKENDLWPKAFIERRVLSEGATLPVGINGVELYATEYMPPSTDLLNIDGSVHLRADAFSQVKLKKAALMFKSAFKFDYDEVPVPWYIKLLVIIVIIIIIIVAVILAIPSGGTSIPAAVAAIAGVISLAATAISLVLSVYASYLVSRGMYRQAEAVGRAIVVLNDIAKYAGYVSMVAGIYSIISNGLMQEVSREAAAQAAKEGLRTGVTEGGRGLVEVSAAQLTNKIAKAIVAIGQYVLEMKAEDDAEDISDAQAALDKQEELMNEYASPTNFAKLVESTDMNSYAEQSMVLDVAPWQMTQGMIEAPFKVYYE